MAPATTPTSGIVIYPLATATGGSAPLSISCSPAPGTAFPLGLSKVTCIVTDALQQSNSCTFTVTIEPRPPAPRLAITRIMAFGNSITQGVNGDDRTSFVPAPYPSILQTALNARYYDQTVTVTSEGVGGEVTSMGLGRFPSALSADHPDLVLLEEGINEINPAVESAIAPMADNLRSMAKLAKAHGAQIFIATLLPERAGPPRNLTPSIIPAANNAIRTAAALEGVPVVDLYAGFGGGPDPYIGADGLHPNQSGYQRIADLFFDAIRARFETVPILPFLSRR